MGARVGDCGCVGAWVGGLVGGEWVSDGWSARQPAVAVAVAVAVSLSLSPSTLSTLATLFFGWQAS